ncbi:MAG: hypothetical protein ACKV2O_11580 [Acidimicrobiales bacterium]
MADRYSVNPAGPTTAFVAIELRLSNSLAGLDIPATARFYLRDHEGHQHDLQIRTGAHPELHLLSSRTVRITPSAPCRPTPPSPDQARDHARGQPIRTNRSVHLGAAVPVGNYVLCAEGLAPPAMFPPRALDVTTNGNWSFAMREDHRPFFRIGQSLVHYEPATNPLAAVLAEKDVDSEATRRLVKIMWACGYRHFVDLSTMERLAPRPLDIDASVLEFHPRAGNPIPIDQLVRNAGQVAGKVGVAPGMLRVGRLVPSLNGRVVLDNELVLGFVKPVLRSEALSLLARVDARLLQDLTDPDGDGLIFVVRFEGRDPEAALALAETWMVDGRIHWVEPHLVEHR